MAKVIAAGEQPTAEEGDDGLIALQGLYDQWANDRVFGKMKAVYKVADYTAREQDAVTIDGGFTVTIPDTFNWNGDAGTDRTPRDLACIQVIDRDAGTFQTYVYDMIQWVALNGLSLTDQAPLAIRGADGLAASLALRYAEQFGQGKLTASIVTKAEQFRASFGNARVDAHDCRESVYY
ncbi:MAG: hypothetical protein ACREUQ_10150 [Burkholderiales bacterium]